MVTLMGTTSKISGGFTVLYADPAAAVMGPIEIEADSFKGRTRFARSLRDSNLNLLILHTFKYPTITFTPTALDGLPPYLTVGDNITFTITGDLTIRDTTASETFTATLNVVSEDRLEGSITTTILRETYSLISFKVPSNVRDIAEEVVLTVNFVALTS
jgi:polyisoprenoid-binding protein YceI